MAPDHVIEYEENPFSYHGGMCDGTQMDRHTMDGGMDRLMGGTIPIFPNSTIVGRGIIKH